MIDLKNRVTHALTVELGRTCPDPQLAEALSDILRELRACRSPGDFAEVEQAFAQVEGLLEVGL
jgi:Xaa-Pro aminopeptidase